MLKIILIIIYLVIGAYVASKKADELVYEDELDIIVSGFLGAFWPLTILLDWIYEK